MTIQQLVLEYSQQVRSAPDAATRAALAKEITAQVKELRRAGLKASATPPVVTKPQRVKPRVK
jgi:hypothetical protein